jgi:hypothetical protein
MRAAAAAAAAAAVAAFKEEQPAKDQDSACLPASSSSSSSACTSATAATAAAPAQESNLSKHVSAVPETPAAADASVHQAAVSFEVGQHSMPVTDTNACPVLDLSQMLHLSLLSHALERVQLLVHSYC